MGRLDGKVALISGGARGQGAVEARVFVEEGACVAFGDILDDEGRRVEAEIRELGGQATYVHLDVTSESDWADAVNAAVSRVRQAERAGEQCGHRPRAQHRGDDGGGMGSAL